MSLYIKRISYLLFVFSSFLMSSCKGDDALTPEITLAKDQITFDTNAGTTTLAFKTNTAWTLSSSETWCTLSPTSGEAGTKQIKVTVTRNNSEAARTATLTVKAGDLSKTVLVTQSLEKLQLDKDSISFDSKGGEFTVNIQATASYTVVVPSWMNVKSTTPDNKSQTFAVTANGSTNLRSGKIVYTSGLLKDSVIVTQTGVSLSIAADASGMSNNAKQLASKMYLGWNLGNTMEAPGGENAWGNPNVTQLLIDSIKAAGFNAIRIPCAWDSHVSDATNHTINPTWLARIKEIVDYCYKNNMYVMLNIHWDGGWLETNCTEAKKAENNIKQKAYWEQIAVYFRNYDEHLLFASANEPNVSNATEMSVLMSYHQTFVNAVRSTGGRNAYRVLIVQGPSTDIQKTVDLMNSWPTDNVSNRIIAEVHYYTPWTFCGLTEDATWGKMAYYWGTGNLSATETSRNYANGEAEMSTLFAKIKTKFVDKGIPVILGEFGALKRSTLSGDALKKHLASRAYFYQCVVKYGRNNGMVPFLWDTGISGNNDMGIFVRTTGVASDKQALTAIQAGAADSSYPY